MNFQIEDNKQNIKNLNAFETEFGYLLIINIDEKCSVDINKISIDNKKNWSKYLFHFLPVESKIWMIPESEEENTLLKDSEVGHFIDYSDNSFRIYIIKRINKFNKNIYSLDILDLQVKDYKVFDTLILINLIDKEGGKYQLRVDIDKIENFHNVIQSFVTSQSKQ